MIKIKVVKDEKGFIWKFRINGHANYDNAGKDIVCSAVTITALNASNAIEIIVGISTDITTKIVGVKKNNRSKKEDEFLLSIPTELKENEKHDIFIIMQTALIGFKEIEKEYSEYVSVVEEEV